jgi:mannosyltransferase OCH1-like enzyme
MIPRIIHYCWFGLNPMPKTDLVCMGSWKKHFPDWEIKLWNEDTFSEKNEFLDKMQNLGKWGLYTEYVRFWALSKFGGLYFDTDVEVLKPFNELLRNSYFLGFEKPGQVNVAVIGSVVNHPFNRLMLDYYEAFKFSDEIKWSVLITGPLINELINIEGKNELIEFMPNSFLYPVECFYPLPFENADVLDKNKFVTKNSYAIHYWNATWVDPWSLLWAGRFKSGWSVIMKTLLNKPLQSRAFYKNVLFHVKCAIVGYPK